MILNNKMKRKMKKAGKSMMDDIFCAAHCGDGSGHPPPHHLSLCPKVKKHKSFDSRFKGLDAIINDY